MELVSSNSLQAASQHFPVLSLIPGPNYPTLYQHGPKNSDYYLAYFSINMLKIIILQQT